MSRLKNRVAVNTHRAYSSFTLYGAAKAADYSFMLGAELLVDGGLTYLSPAK